jgi:tripartite-type tricarboxylate transporter receptor subunit TctC
LVVLVHPSAPASNIPELSAYAKANAGKLNLASAGTGSAPHMAAELFNFMADSACCTSPTVARGRHCRI